MAFLVHFTTARFDVSAETPNPINPIAGQGVLLWLKACVEAAGYEVTEPDTEDWGWYMDVMRGDEGYLVGASGDGESGDARVDWIVQIHPRRSLTDRLLGRNKPVADDPLFVLIAETVRDQPDFGDVETEVDG